MNGGGGNDSTRKAKRTLRPGFLPVNRAGYRTLREELRAADDDGGRVWRGAMMTLVDLAVDYANPDSGVVPESLASLAANLELNRRTVTAHIRLLEVAGMVERHHRGGWQVVVFDQLQGREADPDPVQTRVQTSVQTPVQKVHGRPAETPPKEVEKGEERPEVEKGEERPPPPARAGEDDDGGGGESPSADNPPSSPSGEVGQERGDDVNSGSEDGGVVDLNRHRAATTDSRVDDALAAIAEFAPDFAEEFASPQARRVLGDEIMRLADGDLPAGLIGAAAAEGGWRHVMMPLHLTRRRLRAVDPARDREHLRRFDAEWRGRRAAACGYSLPDVEDTARARWSDDPDLAERCVEAFREHRGNRGSVIPDSGEMV